MKQLNLSDIGILADDLTGACDVAACFVRVAGPVVVFVSPAGFSGRNRTLAVVNTASRSMTAEDSRAIVRSIGKRLSGKSIIFKKICSALRGNVGAELDGLLEAVGNRKVIIAPAIPKIGRTTRDGIQYDCGLPVNRTYYARDPVSPVHNANIVRIVAETGRTECEVGNARTDEDLRKIVAGALLKNRQVVFAGSVGLAQALAGRIKPVVAGLKNVPAAERILLVCGSPYPQAREQIEKAVSHYGIQTMILDSVAKVNALRQWPAGKTSVIVRTTGRSSGQPFQTLSGFVNAVAELVVRVKPDGLGIVGGETAFHLLRKLKVNRLKVYGQKEEVISFGIMTDGLLKGRPFTMKGGSVGPKNAAIIMVEQILSKEL